MIGVRLRPQAVESPGYISFIRSGPEVGTYVRVGSTNRRADADLVAEMQRFARGEFYDERPMPDLDSEAVDFRVASESFTDVRKLKRRDLETLRLLTSHQGHKLQAIGEAVAFVEKHALHSAEIGRVFHELGLVEQWGSGAQRMITACKDSGLASPVWEEIGSRLRVTIYTEQVGKVVAAKSPKSSVFRRAPPAPD